MNQNRLEEKTGFKKASFSKGVKGFVIILLAGLLMLTGLTYRDHQKESLTEASLSGIRELAMMDNETEVVQKFRAKFPTLDNIYIYFANEQEGRNEGVLNFQILDKDGKEVAGRTLEAKEIVNKDFTKISIGETLKPGAKYQIVVSGEGLTAGKSPIIYREKKSVGNNDVRLNGESGYTKLEVRYEYPAEATLQMLFLMAGCILLMGLVLVKKETLLAGKRAKAAVYIEKFLFFTTPLFAFYIVEHFTYNSIMNIYPVAIVMNIVIYYALYFLGYMISNSRKANVIGCLVISYLLGAANYFVLTFRGTPILPTDMASFTTAMNVAENYSYSLNSTFFTSLLLLLFLCIVYCRCSSQRTVKMNVKRRFALLGTVVCVALGVAGLIGQEKFLLDNKVKADIWNQKRGYSRDGALASFCLNAKYLYTEKPEGYSVEKVKEIAETYIWDEKETASLKGVSSRKKGETPKEAGKTDKKDKKTKADQKADAGKKASKNQKKNPNIIMIMNEAFSDLQVINPIDTNKDYMPFIHKLKKNTIKGNLFVSIFGAGTCNSEFEVLTGNSMAFLPSGSIGYTQFVKDAMPNMVQVLKKQGYTGNYAVHPYLADGWNRPTVYSLFGFNKFLSQDDFENPEMVRKYISDKEDFKKLISLYEENRKEEKDDPCFLFTVTMQNHGGFSKDYGNMENEIEITDNALKDSEAEQYLSLIKKSDDAFKMLVRYFKKQDEPTMIVMWGDHQPSVHDEFYQKLYGKDMNKLTVEELQKKYQVPFIIWTNYDIEEKEIEAMSANYLGAYILNLAGLKMTPYQRYLLDLSEKLPVINAVGYIGDDGKYYEHDDETEYSDYISNYKILQYNNIIDFKNRYDNFFGADNLVD